MKATNASIRTKSSGQNKRNSYKGPRVITTNESENSKKKAKPGAPGRNDDQWDMGPQDFDDVELQKSIKGSNKAPSRQPLDKKSYLSSHDKKLGAIYQSRTQVLNESQQKPPKSPLRSTEAGTKVLGTGNTAINSGFQQRTSLEEATTPTEFKENIDMKNGLQVDDHRSQASKKSFGMASAKQRSFMGGNSDAGELKIENERLQTQMMIIQQKLKGVIATEMQIKMLQIKSKNQGEAIQKHQKENLELKGKVNSQENEISFLKSQIDQLEKTIEDLNGTVKEKDEEIDKVEESRADQKQDIEELNQNLQSQEEELYGVKKELHETFQELDYSNQQLESAQSKIAGLMDNVEELAKGQAVYIGHKNDRIDTQLAGYLKTYPEKEKMKILFLRESEGVYQFGQKRVYIKIEKGNQIKVRVGGGFMHIDDFIEQYTPQEVERIERRADVITRFDQKLSMQKITQDQSVNAYEEVPVSSPQRPKSPSKRQGSPNVRRSMQGSPFSPARRSPKGSPNKKKRQSMVE